MILIICLIQTFNTNYFILLNNKIIIIYINFLKSFNYNKKEEKK